MILLLKLKYYGYIMNEEEKLKFYLERLKLLAEEKLTNKTTALQALKESLNIIEGELIGY